VDDIVDFVKQSQFRPIMLMAIPLDIVQLIASLYDAGVKYTEVIIIAIQASFAEVQYLATEAQYDKVAYYKDSWIAGDFATFVDEQGAHVEALANSKFSSAVFVDCFSYDLANLSVLALDFIQKRGMDFYNWRDTMQALKAMKFKGCTGRISFSKEHNDRMNIDYDFSQIREVDGNLIDYKVLRTSLYGQSYFNYAELEWYEGKTELPRQNKFTYAQCPFPEEHRQPDKASGAITLAIHWSFVCIVLLVSSVTYFAFHRQRPFLDNVDPIVLSTQDYIVLASYLIEVLMLDLVGPGGGLIVTVFGNSLAIWKRYDFSQGIFYLYLRLAYCLCSLGTLLSVIVVCKNFKPLMLDLHLLTFFLIKTFRSLAAIVLLTTIDCSDAHSQTDPPEYDEAVMDVDCYEDCWKGRHLKYSVASCFLLLVYLLFPIPYSSRFTNKLEGLQFRTNPLYITSTQPFVLAVIALHKTRGVMSYLSNSLCFMVLYLCLLGFCWKVKVFSIPKLTAIHNMLLFMLTLSYLSIILYQLTVQNLVLWSVLWGTIMCTIVGVYVVKMRRLPTLITTFTRVDSMAIYRFAFTRRRKYKTSDRSHMSTVQRHLVSSSRQLSP